MVPNEDSSPPCTRSLGVRFPISHKLINENYIEDDVLASFHMAEEEIATKLQLQVIFNEMGLEPHKWSSNHEKKIIEDIPLEKPAKEVILSVPSIDLHAHTVSGSIPVYSLIDPYIGNHIKKIIEKSHQFNQWHHIRMEDNLAALPT